MPRATKFLVRKLAGRNGEVDATAIGDNELAELQNWYNFEGELRRRGGLTKVTSSSAWSGQTVNSMFAYKVRSGVWKLLVGGDTKLGFLSGNAIQDVPIVGASAFTSSTIPMKFNQYKDIVYVCRTQMGTLYRTDALSIAAAGISPPTTAAVLAEGGSGDLAAGNYIGVVTFYNSATGAESNPSPVSNTLALSASKEIDWSSIPVSTNPQVDSRRIYRTLVDQQGEYYEVTTISDNVTTTLTEDVLQVDMGDPVSFDNGLPPDICKVAEVFTERLWISDGVDLFFSEFGLPENFSEFSVIQVSPDDGHSINGLLAYGNVLLVGKTNAVHYIIGADESDFELKMLDDTAGVVSHESMRTAKGLAFWFGGNNFYEFNGNSVEPIGDDKVRDLISTIDPDYYSKVVGAIDTTNRWYIAAIPANGSSTITHHLVYDYKQKIWSTFTWTNSAPHTLEDFFNSSGSRVLYCSAQDGNLYKYNDGTTDDGTAIACRFDTKKFGFDRDDVLKIVRETYVHGNSVDGTANARLLVDDVDQGAVSFSTASAAGAWKTANTSSKSAPGEYVQLRVDYSGVPEWRVKGYGMKVVDLNRKRIA